MSEEVRSDINVAIFYLSRNILPLYKEDLSLCCEVIDIVAKLRKVVQEDD